MQLYRKMATMLDEVGPHQWAISFTQLPKANSATEFLPYVDEARRFYASLPQAIEHGPHFNFDWSGPYGDLRLEAIPFPQGTEANHLGPAVSFMDDSIQRLKDALLDSHKRRQAIGAWRPVLLAVDCPFNSPDIEEFDQALFGQTVDHRGFNIDESVGTSFRANGLLVTDQEIPFAGVLAFLQMSMIRCS